MRLGCGRIFTPPTVPDLAKLTVSDCAGEKEPGSAVVASASPNAAATSAKSAGPIGQEIIYNFIEVMPHLEY